MTNHLLPYTSFSNHAPDICINFHTRQDFQNAESALYKLRTTRSGTLLLNRIRNVSTDEKKLMIRVNDNVKTGHMGFLTASQIDKFKMPTNTSDPDHKAAVRMFSHKKFDGTNGDGTNVVVSYNPRQSIGIDVDGFPVNMNDGRHPEAMLAHELVHAFHLMNGTSLATHKNDVWFYGKGQRMEEERATGLGEYRLEPFSENSVRAELGLPLRASYFYRNLPAIT